MDVLHGLVRNTSKGPLGIVFGRIKNNFEKIKTNFDVWYFFFFNKSFCKNYLIVQQILKTKKRSNYSKSDFKNYFYT